MGIRLRREDVTGWAGESTAERGYVADVETQAKHSVSRLYVFPDPADNVGLVCADPYFRLKGIAWVDPESDFEVGRLDGVYKWASIQVTRPTGDARAPTRQASQESTQNCSARVRHGDGLSEYNAVQQHGQGPREALSCVLPNELFVRAIHRGLTTLPLTMR